MRHVSPDAFDLPAIPRPRVGERSVQTHWAIFVRGWYLQLAARKFFSHLPSDRQRAKALHDAITLYAGTAWPRERAADVCPARHKGKVNAYCWAILRLHDNAPCLSIIREALR